MRRCKKPGHLHRNSKGECAECAHAIAVKRYRERAPDWRENMREWKELIPKWREPKMVAGLTLARLMAGK